MHNKVVAMNDQDEVVIVVCAVCLKIKITEDHWEKKHHSISDMLTWHLFTTDSKMHTEMKEDVHQKHFNNVLVSHGLCPICFSEQMRELQQFIIRRLESKTERSEIT